MTSLLQKEVALAQIVELMRTHNIPMQEVATALGQEKPKESAPKRGSTDSIRLVFAYLGAVFIIAGIGTYISMFWATMGSGMRIFVTLGTGFMLFALEMIALREGKYPRLIMPLALFAAMMQTTGWFVAIHELFPSGGDVRRAELFVFGIMALQQSVVFMAWPRPLMALLSLVYMYLFLHVTLELLEVREDWIALVLGMSLIGVAQGLEKTPQRALSGWAFFIGAIWFNGGLFGLLDRYVTESWAAIITGISVCALSFGFQQSGRYLRLQRLGYFVGSALLFGGFFNMLYQTAFDIVFPLVCVVGFYACTQLRSRELLATSALALLSFVAYYTTEHFLNVIGWPIALILIGVAFFAISTLAMRVKNSFTPQSA